MIYECLEPLGASMLNRPVLKMVKGYLVSRSYRCVIWHECLFHAYYACLFGIMVCLFPLGDEYDASAVSFLLQYSCSQE